MVECRNDHDAFGATELVNQACLRAGTPDREPSENPFEIPNEDPVQISSEAPRTLQQACVALQGWRHGALWGCRTLAYRYIDQLWDIYEHGLDPQFPPASAHDHCVL